MTNKNNLNGFRRYLICPSDQYCLFLHQFIPLLFPRQGQPENPPKIGFGKIREKFQNTQTLNLYTVISIISMITTTFYYCSTAARDLTEEVREIKKKCQKLF